LIPLQRFNKKTPFGLVSDFLEETGGIFTTSLARFS
jgi:hypothetical protein